MLLTEICTIVSLAIALLSVCVSLYSIREARRTAISSAYFNEMVSAYTAFLRSVSEFVYKRGLDQRDELSASLYRLLLFATPLIATGAQDIHDTVLRWAQSGESRALSIDARLHALEDLMREDLAAYRKGGTHETL